MERPRVITLAAAVAVVMVLLSVRYLIDRDPASDADAVRVDAADDQGSRAVGIQNRTAESRRASHRAPFARQPPEPPRERRAGDATDDGEVGSAEVIGGAQGDRQTLGRSASGRPGALAANEGTADNDGSDTRAHAPAAPAGGGVQPSGQHRPSGPAEEPAADDASHDAAPVLLSIPLKGSVDPAQGGSPTQADGVVVDKDTVEFTDDAQYTLPAGGHINGQEGSIAFDIEPRWNGGDQTNNSLLQIRDPENWANNLQIVKNLDSLRFVITDSAGVETDVVVNIADWQADQSHRVTATWGEALMTLYVDGEPVGQSTLTNGPTFKSTTPIHVGSDFPGSQYGSANGRISNLTIYGRPLKAGEVN